jgi:exosortase
LVIGAAAIVFPTMFDVARFNWSTEQGGHGPIVLATGLWLLWREARSMRGLESRSIAVPASITAAFLMLYVAARITGIIEIEAFAMYGALVASAFMFLDGKTLRKLWFPLFYLALAIPPPDSLVATITQPIKIMISQEAVNLLYGLGYPVASSGVTIQIAQYELLVAAACAGLNSIISLSAICLLYVYLRHRTDPAYMLALVLMIIPVTIFSNFIRVVLLILITYYLGEAAAQGFLHDFAGLLMFGVALVTIFLLDELVSPFFNARRKPSQS